MRNKKGLIGKILLVLLIIFLIVIAIAAITAYQIYHVYQVAKTEKNKIDANMEELNSKMLAGDCSKINEIESSIYRISDEAQSACKNPIIKIGVRKYMADKPIDISGQKVTVSCEDLVGLYEQAQSQFKPIKELCSNMSKIVTNSSNQQNINLINLTQ